MKHLEVLFEDEHYIAINKPSGVLTIPDRFKAEIPNLLTQLKKKHSSIFTVHRIDGKTSGVVCFAKTEEAHKHLNTQFEEHSLSKTYQALVVGKTPETGEIDLRIFEDPTHPGRMECSLKFGKPAQTAFKTLQHFGNDYSWVEVYPKTGRTHQIRVHFLAIGHPLMIDEYYGSPEPFFLSTVKRKYKLSKFQEEEIPVMSRLTLHASKLEFKHVTDEHLVTIEAPLPKDFAVVVKQLGKAFEK